MNHKKHDDIGQWVQDLTLACCMVTKTCIHKINMTYIASSQPIGKACTADDVYEAGYPPDGRDSLKTFRLFVITYLSLLERDHGILF
ncbi:hypothetical protein DY000_02031992 [Brassica cretica]|uniref:Uncharacterized protein n=1 Tax=Brassica cretica TaxID=69181 RepID=A0ABQ7DTW0_BRACR|nr:hypothetical protein DY000_02031992 [Brassica cretica]